jgi:L-lactate utilization protein LutB
MDQSMITYRAKVAQQMIKAFNKRHMEASYALDGDQAREELLALIPEGVSVCRAGSLTLDEIGFWDALKKRGDVEIVDQIKPGLPPEEAWDIRLKGLSADYLVTGTNAVTLDGRLVNLDRTGNRVAAMTFGPKKIILAVGMNKVVSDLEEAMKRVKNLAAPANAIRINAKTPCVKTGLCTECSSPERLCNLWSIIEGNFIKGRIHVKLIGQSLGL